MDTKATVTAQSYVADQLSLSYQVTAVALAFASNFFAGLVATLMSTYLPGSVHDLVGTFKASEVSYVGSYVGSLFLIGWTLGGISFGWIGDRFGRVCVFGASILFFSLFTLVTAWSPNWYVLVLFRFLAGLGVGATMVLSAVLISEIWGKQSRGRAVALSIMAVGFPIGIIVTGVVSYLLPDWRSAFRLSGLIASLLAVLSFLFLKEPGQWLSYSESKKTNRTSPFNLLLSSVHRINLWVGTIIFGAMLVGIWAVFSWLPTWAQSLVGTETGSQQEGAILMMLLGGGGIIGCLLAGFLGNWMGRRGALLLSFAGAFLATCLLFWTNSTFTTVIYYETAFLSLFFGVSQGILTFYIPELFPTSVRSTATGVCFNAGRVITAGGVFFVGILVPVLGGYGNALFVFSLTYAFGFIVTWFGSETKGVVL